MRALIGRAAFHRECEAVADCQVVVNLTLCVCVCRRVVCVCVCVVRVRESAVRVLWKKLFYFLWQMHSGLMHSRLRSPLTVLNVHYGFYQPRMFFLRRR